MKQKLLSRNFTFEEAVSKAIAQEAARKDVKDIADSYREKPVLAVTVVVLLKWRVTTGGHAVVFQSEEKVTQETENQVSPPETRSGASAVASRITHMITAGTKV